MLYVYYTYCICMGLLKNLSILSVVFNAFTITTGYTLCRQGVRTLSLQLHDNKIYEATQS